MKRITIFILGLILQSCALPQYQTRLVPFNNKVPFATKDQAVTICQSEAELAGANARNAVQARINQKNSRVSSYNCTSQSYNEYSCTPQTTSGGVFSSLSDYYTVQNAAENEGRSTLLSCLSRLGWRAEQYCIKNCEYQQ